MITEISSTTYYINAFNNATYYSNVLLDASLLLIELFANYHCPVLKPSYKSHTIEHNNNTIILSNAYYHTIILYYRTCIY